MEIREYRFEPTDGIPNSDRPLLLVKGAVSVAEASAPTMTDRLEANGWVGTWTYTIFDFWHFHHDGHEVLACVAGEALVGFGGPEDEGGASVTLRPGDVAIVPAGVGHKRLNGDPGFQVVGAYPPGQGGTVVRAGEMDGEAAKAAIAALSEPRRDPITGETPGIFARWG